MYGYELDELLKQYGLSNPSNAYGGTPMPTGPITIDNAAQQAAYDADQAKYQEYLKEYSNRLQNTNMYSAPEFQSPATHSDLYAKQVSNSVVPQIGTPAYETYTKNVNSQLQPNSLGMLNQDDLAKLMDKYGENRYDLVNATGSWWGDVLKNPNYQNYQAAAKVTTPATVLPSSPVGVIVDPTLTVTTITGVSGNDTVTAGKGNDTIKGGNTSGTSSITGASGNDTVTGSTGTTGTTGTTGFGTNTGTGTGSSTVSGVGTITGGKGNDTITGSTGIGTGTSGTGTVTGGTGNDTITTPSLTDIAKAQNGTTTSLPNVNSNLELPNVTTPSTDTITNLGGTGGTSSPSTIEGNSFLEGEATNLGYQGDLTDTAAMQRFINANVNSNLELPNVTTSQSLTDIAKAQNGTTTSLPNVNSTIELPKNVIGPSLTQAEKDKALADELARIKIANEKAEQERIAAAEKAAQEKIIQDKKLADEQAKAAADALAKQQADEQARIEKEKTLNNFVGPVSNTQNQNNQPATLDNLVSAYNINQPNSVQMGPYTQEQQKAIDATKTTTNDLANKYNVNDFVGPVSNTPNQSTSSNEINNLVSAYNINQPNSVQTGPYTPDQQKVIDEQIAKKQAADQAAADKLAAKQAELDKKAKEQPTIENIAAKYGVVPDAVKAAQLMATKGISPEDAADAMPDTLQNIKNPAGFRHLYTLMDEFKTNDLPADKVPTVAELAKHYNVGENTILAALLLNSNATQQQTDDFIAKHPLDTYQQMYAVPDIANAIRVKLGKTVQAAASEANATNPASGLTNTTGTTGATGTTGTTGATTSTVVPNPTTGGLTSTVPITQPTTQPQAVEAVKQITQAADLANKIVEKTKDQPNAISQKDAKTIAVEYVTIPKDQLKDFTEQTLLDSLGDFAKMVMPGPAYVLDSLGNIIQGQAPMDPVDYARNIYSKDISVDVSKYVPDFIKNWMNGDNTASTDINSLPENYNKSGHLLELFVLELFAPKDANSNESNPVAVIKVPTTDAVTEKFADVIQNNLNNPDAIQKYAKENNLGDTALTKAVQFAKDNANSIKQFDEAAATAQANGTLQNGKMIGSELFPTTIAAIDALVDGAVPLNLGIPLIAEIKSLINGTNYDDALAQESNDFNHWAAANPNQTKVLQTLGVLGASQITGGLGPYDSIKINNIWNQDLGVNARSIAVNLNDKGPITATPIDSKGNAIGETITLNKDSLPTNFFDTIGTNVTKSYNDIIGSIEHTAGSIGDFLSGGNEEQLPEDFTGSITYPDSTTPTSTGNAIYDNVIKGLGDLWGNKNFSSLGTLAPSTDWGFNPSDYSSSPGYYDLSSPTFWGESLGNDFGTGFSSDWGSSGIPSGWDMSDFGFGAWDGAANAYGQELADLGQIQVAKGGSVSKEIDRLYKKYGGRV